MHLKISWAENPSRSSKFRNFGDGFRAHAAILQNVGGCRQVPTRPATAGEFWKASIDLPRDLDQKPHKIDLIAMTVCESANKGGWLIEPLKAPAF